MSTHKTLVTAIANAAPPDEAELIIGSALELAIAECDVLYRVLLQKEMGDVALVAAAIEGRLRALDALIAERMSVTWREGREPGGAT